jgi:hypothetical protein
MSSRPTLYLNDGWVLHTAELLALTAVNAQGSPCCFDVFIYETCDHRVFSRIYDLLAVGFIF